MHVVAFANQKGGVGKTTSTVNTAVILAARGYGVLLIDADPQGNSTSSLGIDKPSLTSTLYNVLIEDTSVLDAVQSDVRPNLDVVAATPELAAAEIELVEQEQRERHLTTALSDVASTYDIVLIDCPPSLGLLTINALTAANNIIVPIQCEFLALEGVSQLLQTVDLTRRQLNPELDLLGVLMTMYDSRTRLSAAVVDEVRSYFPDRLFRAIVPRSVRLAEAPSYGQAISEYDATSKGGDAYLAVVDELIDRLALIPSFGGDRQ